MKRYLNQIWLVRFFAVLCLKVNEVGAKILEPLPDTEGLDRPGKEAAVPIFTAQNSPKLQKPLFTQESLSHYGSFDTSFRQAKEWATRYSAGTMTESQIQRAMEVGIKKREPAPELRGCSCSETLKELVFKKRGLWGRLWDR